MRERALMVLVLCTATDGCMGKSTAGDAVTDPAVDEPEPDVAIDTVMDEAMEDKGEDVLDAVDDPDMADTSDPDVPGDDPDSEDGPDVFDVAGDPDAVEVVEEPDAFETADCLPDADPFMGQTRLTADDGEASWAPSIAWTGSEMGIAWTDSRFADEEIFFGRFDSNGTLIGPEIQVTSDDGARSAAPVLAWTGSVFGIIWQDRRDTDIEIFFASLAPDGSVVASETRVTDFPYLVLGFDMAASSSELGIVWHHDQLGSYEVFLSRITPLGARLGSDLVASDDDGIGSSIAAISWSGSRFALAWNDLRDGSTEIYYRTFEADGTGATASVRLTDDDGLASGSPELAWSGSEVGMTWSEYLFTSPELRFGRFAPDGSRIAIHYWVSSADGMQSAYQRIAWSGSFWAITWQDARSDVWEVYLALMQATGPRIGSEIPVSLDDGESSSGVRVLSAGGPVAIVWQDTKDLDTELYFDLFTFCP